MAQTIDNPIGIQGMAFIEFSSKEPEKLAAYFRQLGIPQTGTSKKGKTSRFSCRDILFLLNEGQDTFAAQFTKSHGPAACAMGWKVTNASVAFESAVANGARPYREGKSGIANQEFPAVYGIGDSLIYFIDAAGEKVLRDSYNEFSDTNPVKDAGLISIDHLTNNVPVGEMQKWCDFYSKIFNFKEVRYFDIKGLKTGLISKVMVSPGYKVMIPINEPTDKKSQIQEYLEQYNGSGIQHIAFLTKNAIKTVEVLSASEVRFLDSPPKTYYDMLRARIKPLREEPEDLRKLSLLADGDDEGYIVQIFTKNAIGPIFFEIIQRENHMGFGDGNFQALFDSIERDQMARGYIK